MIVIRAKQFGLYPKSGNSKTIGRIIDRDLDIENKDHKKIMRMRIINKYPALHFFVFGTF